MEQEYKFPPNPQYINLKRVYPWDEYNKTLIMQWLYRQAVNTGFPGTFENFQEHYGNYIEPDNIYDLIEHYTGSYSIIPLVDIEQVLQTKDKVLDHDIIVSSIPDEIVNKYSTYDGNYEITPLAYVSQTLRTNNKILEDNITIAEIPYAEVSNDANGKTVTIG